VVALPTSGEPLACVVCGGREARPLFVKQAWTFARCRGCGLVSLHPRPTPAAIVAHHDASYRDGRYAAFATAETVRAAIARRRLALVRPLAPEGPWLDVGCSTGTLLAEGARAGVAMEGLELSAPAVAQARASGLTVHHGAAESFVPPQRYAAVTAFDVVEHLPDPAVFLRRAMSWLVPGGVLALTTPDAASPTARLMGRHWFYYAPPDHIHYFTPSTIRRLLTDCGFGELTIRAVGKPLTLDYAVAQLGAQNPYLHRIAGALEALLPRGWRTRPWAFPLGEMLVTGRRSSVA
jgi:SAM-dependent methyltransferase